MRARPRLALALALSLSGAPGCTFATNFARPIVEPPPDAPDDAGPDGDLPDAETLDATESPDGSDH